jgi:hypothetical protein
MMVIWKLIRWRGRLQVLGYNQAVRMLIEKSKESGK